MQAEAHWNFNYQLRSRRFAESSPIARRWWRIGPLHWRSEIIHATSNKHFLAHVQRCKLEGDRNLPSTWSNLAFQSELKRKKMLKNALTKTARCQKEIKPTLKEACSQVNESAICVQKLDDSRNSAIRITYRISLRSSSLREPRYPLLRVVVYFWSLGDMLSHITTTRVQSN